MLLMMLLARPLFKRFVARWIRIIMKERYDSNIWEIVTAVTRMSPQTVVENSLRAEMGEVIERPFGSPKKYLSFDGLIFSSAQLVRLPADESAVVNTKVTIGPKASRPLILDIPLLLGGMGYGVGISEQTSVALAMGTAAVGTAANTGEGGFLQEVRDRAKYLIVQYHKGKWAKEHAELKQADAIEIHFGQGASAAAANRISPEDLTGKARQVLKLEPDETALLASRYPDIQKPSDLKKLVIELRKLTDGVPIGIKLNPSHALEQDMEFGIKATVDFISIDGGQAGTKGSAPILEDDFGLPTIYALSRAVQYLKKRSPIRKLSLLIGGGFFTPGDCLKALALGADAVYLGTAPLWAMTHTQVSKTLPFEPPTQLVYYSGKRKDDLDEYAAADNLKKFFLSFIEEMKVATLALGKTNMGDVNEQDLVALDDLTSKVTRIPTSYDLHERSDRSWRS